MVKRGGVWLVTRLNYSNERLGSEQMSPQRNQREKLCEKPSEKALFIDN